MLWHTVITLCKHTDTNLLACRIYMLNVLHIQLYLGIIIIAIMILIIDKSVCLMSCLIYFSTFVLASG